MLGILEHIMLKGKDQTEKLGHTRHDMTHMTRHCGSSGVFYHLLYLVTNISMYKV
jgi:hypothetical protein